ncbi:MAG: hypothetical protein Q7T82_08690 [Armatimonadota bacterium]|nr:hypothetical protein [Armatimonadota bacterium]
MCHVIRPALAALAILCLAAVSPGLAVSYSGSLTYSPGPPPDSGDGLYVGIPGLQWVNYNVSISWTVTNDDPISGNPWKYTYTFGHDGTQAGISHVIIEGSEGISASDIAGLTGATLYSTGIQYANPGTPGMPEDLYGLRFNPLAEGQFGMTWSFWSDRAPVWGDFYARCGGKMGGINRVYNYNNTGGVENGFLDPNGDDALLDDIDPAGPASNGSLDFHILRPDSVVPEPSGLLALLCGAVGLGGIITRSRRR